MSRWNNDFQNQQALQKVQTGLNALEKAKIESLTPEARGEYERAIKVLKLLEARFLAFDPELFPINTWVNFSQWLLNAQNQAVAFSTDQNGGHLPALNNYLDQVLTALRPIDIKFSGNEVKALAEAGEIYRKKILEELELVKKGREETKGQHQLLLAEISQSNDSLKKLHPEQTSVFDGVIKKHEENLKAIELTYDQKLALQKPVAYWETKERYHGRLAFRFGIAAISSFIVLASTLGISIHAVLGGLGPNENPKNWQIGVLLVALFFSIWLMRIIVRLFLSHLHLSGDAAERRTMILTYLSMSREGSNFGSEDKKLILQHLFRSASDGLVKDDAAPPTPMEFLSRRF